MTMTQQKTVAWAALAAPQLGSIPDNLVALLEAILQALVTYIGTCAGTSESGLAIARNPSILQKASYFFWMGSQLRQHGLEPWGIRNVLMFTSYQLADETTSDEMAQLYIEAGVIPPPLTK